MHPVQILLQAYLTIVGVSQPGFGSVRSNCYNTTIDCGSEVNLRPGDVVICRECGYRILYKKRTKQGKSLSL